MCVSVVCVCGVGVCVWCVVFGMELEVWIALMLD